MTQPKFRARTFRRVFRKTPGGNTVLHHERRKNSRPTCPICGIELHAARMSAVALRKLPRSGRRIERPLPNLCPKCMRQKMKDKARAQRSKLE
jgi:large subunit ribosomal protein L34e